ncbi:hypothetical protein [Dongia sp. agr-C8]
MSEVAVPLYSLIALLTFLLVAFLVVKIVVWLVRRLAAIGFVHTDKSVRLISLAIALLLFPSFVRDVFAYFSDVVRSLAFYSPRAIAYSTSSVASACGGVEDAAQCFSRAWEIYLQFVQDILQAFTRTGGYGEIPIEAGDLLQTAIYLLAVWVLTAHVLVLIFNVDPPSPTLDRIRAAAKARPATVKNLALFAMLAFASYLSFASIAAIPTLEREDTPKEVDDASLTKLLEDSAKTLSDALGADTGTRLVADPFASDSIQKSAEGQGVATAEFNSRKALATARNKELIDNAEALKRQIAESLAALQSIAISTYQTVNLKRIGARATIDHYRAMHGWFIRGMNAHQQNLSDCHRAIFAYQRAAIVALSGKPGQPTPGYYDGGDMKQQQLGPPEPYSGAGNYGGDADDTGLYHTAVENCAFRSPQEPVPLRGNIENYVGSFGVAISWLLRSESQPLVLIVGLLGFGLLGAACSTFVREVSRRSGGDGALVEDLAGVVIRGVSAAVVVFLAVYGGLAIFGTNAEPNPYVVLFTCLVGAVFSDTVWDWAQSRLQDSFAKEGGGGRTDKAGGDETGEGSTKRQPSKERKDKDDPSA